MINVSSSSRKGYLWSCANKTMDCGECRMEMFASLMEILTVRRSGKARLDPSLTLNSTSHLPAGMPGAFTCLPVWTSLTCTCKMSAQQRTLSDPNQRPTKRRKLQLACTQCRDRKTRCDGGRPVCSTCDRRGKAAACVYEQDELPTLQYGDATLPVATVPNTVAQARPGCREPPQAIRGPNTRTMRYSNNTYR